MIEQDERKFEVSFKPDKVPVSFSFIKSREKLPRLKYYNYSMIRESDYPLEFGFENKNVPRYSIDYCKKVEELELLNSTNSMESFNFTKSPEEESHQSSESEILLNSTINKKFPIDSIPMTCLQALSSYSEDLTQFEKKEILQYTHVYYLGCSAEKLEDRFTARNGSYQIRSKDHIAYRFEIIKQIGEGAFGEVIECFDHKKDQRICLKIMKKLPETRKMGEKEAKILTRLNENYNNDSQCIVKMNGFFEFRGHFCISFELLSMNLSEFMKKSNFQSLNTTVLRRIAIQLLKALKYIHGLNLIHSDIKPDNIMLKSPHKTQIKVIDFGAAFPKSTAFYYYIQSRYYRAPEIILEAPYSNKIDIWSFGCVLYELLTGEALFVSDSESGQLIEMIKVLGSPPDEVLEQSYRKEIYFECEDRQIYKRGEKISCKTINERIECDYNLSDLISRCLKWNENERISADEALEHPWIRGKERIFRRK